MIKQIKLLCDLKYYNSIGLHIANYVIDNNKHLILHYAIDDNNIPLCTYLLNDKQIISYPLIFSYVIKKNNNKLIKVFINYIKSYASNQMFNEIDIFQETPLSYATYNNNYELSKILIYNNANINGLKIQYKKKINNTPLYNADPNIWSHTGYGNIGELPLHSAINNNNYKICKLLIIYGADPLLELHISCKYGSTSHSSPLQLVLNNISKKFKFLKLFQYYHNVLNIDEYLNIKKNRF